MPSQHEQAIHPGLAILQSNRMGDLKTILLNWLRDHPLPPLEAETILVQSNGMAQWLKLGLAADQGIGISADLQTMLPSTFLWRVYRTILSDSSIPESSPLDREPMTWRIFGMLPKLVLGEDPIYDPLRKFLKNDPHQQRRYQLAGQIAGLYDQYQVYRPDWLRQWSAHEETTDIEIPEAQQWQPPLWRALVEPLEDHGDSTSRAFLNDQLIAQLDDWSKAGKSLPKGIPRRLIIFGISSLPSQTLQAIRALSEHIQILYFVQNPCQHYWADILDAREASQKALRMSLKRHKARNQGFSPPPDDLHLEGHPLLAAWGKQGRDFVRLLDDLDTPSDYQSWFQQIDVFDEVPASRANLLHQIQNAILNRDPLPSSKKDLKVVSLNDASISFHVAHTRQREVEALHDQLLRLFDQKSDSMVGLTPRDVIVMVPDVDHYAPHIEAVFGQIATNDPRFIPFSIADRQQRGHNSLHVALEYLLNLPDVRMTASEVLDLLDVDAIRRKFGLEERDLPLIKRWIIDAGVRWGLDGQHRGPLDPRLNIEQNSWKFGLERMALGYCMGSLRTTSDIAPLGDVGGIEADRLGPLWLFLEALSHHQKVIAHPANPTVWGERLHHLMESFFDPGNKEDRLSLERLEQTLERWLQLCEEAALEEDLDLSVVREAWLTSVDTPSLTQRFLAGRVNFCTLMPMRSIPFKVVCLLGMNDGEFPRIQPRRAFDLMSLPGAYRPGDRSRRDDDRYMFLEAILSAEEKLIMSWVGRQVRDDSELPPSVLVSQLRDYLASGWVLETPGVRESHQTLLEYLTLSHGLQPFSSLYFKGNSPHFSYAREWQPRSGGLSENQKDQKACTLLPSEDHEPLTLQKLERFLKNPAQHFFEQRLGVYFEQSERTTEDIESFGLNALESHVVGSDILKSALRHPGVDGKDIDDALTLHRLSGQLPMAGFGENTLRGLRNDVLAISQRYAALLNQGWSQNTMAPRAIQFGGFTVGDSAYPGVDDWLTDIRVNQKDSDKHARIEYRPRPMLEKETPKRHPLIGLWVRHLAANATGLDLTSYLIAPDATLRLNPLPEPQARAWFETLIQAETEGLLSPLPVAVKTAFAWLKAKPEQRIEKVTVAYEGDDNFNQGEVKTSEYLLRAYPTVEDLLGKLDDKPGFEEWTRRLYQPLHEVDLFEEDAR